MPRALRATIAPSLSVALLLGLAGCTQETTSMPIAPAGSELSQRTKPTADRPLPRMEIGARPTEASEPLPRLERESGSGLDRFDHRFDQFDDSVRDARERLSTGASQVERSAADLRNQANQTVEGLKTQADQTAGRVKQRAGEIENKIDSKLGEIEQQASSRIDAVGRKVDETKKRAGEAAESIEKSAEAVKNLFKSKSSDR